MDISVALGGGGSRGNAHIGVLRLLEREGFNIRAIAGTSFGGIVAAMYAAGYSPDEIEVIFSKVDQPRLYGRAPDDGPSLLGTAGLQKFIRDNLGERTFKGLRIPCAMPAADLQCGCEVVFDSGPLSEAILATCAIPGVFPPRKHGDYTLVDGGVLNPIPVSLARKLAPGLPVVAVVLSAPPESASNLFSVPLPQNIPAVLLERISQLRLAQALNIFMQSVEVGNRMITELRLQVDKPEVIIRPDVEHIAVLDNVDVPTLTQIGEDATRLALPELARQFSIPARISRTLRMAASK